MRTEVKIRPLRHVDMTQKAREYQGIPLFLDITVDELAQLLPCLRATEKTFEKGENIIMESDRVRRIGIVLDGSVYMLKDDVWGRQTMIGYIARRELFGESFAVRSDDASYVTFQAASKARILFLAAGNIIHQCPRACSFHTTIGENMFRLMGEKSVSLMEKIDIVSKTSLREKLMAYLSMLSQKQNSDYVDSPLNRSELAGYLCVNRSAMTRELSNMRDDGLIDFEKNTYHILSRGREVQV